MTSVVATHDGRDVPLDARRKTAPARRPTAGLDASRPLSVSRVANRLAEIVEDRMREVRAVWIRGEIGDLRSNAGGTLRFTLSDGASRIDCIWWAPPSNAAPSLTDGAQVVVKGRPKVFARVVGLVCVVTEVRPTGVGVGTSAREQVRARLSADGLFEPSRKRKLPCVPRAVAIITGRSSAAWHDVLAIASRRHPGIPIVLVPAQMQGDAAPVSIRTALQAVEASGLFDVVIITRGGGAAGDLLVFDDESLARAMAACSVPVVTAIGHELDFSIADAVADCREPTPSAAAARVIPDRRELGQQVHDCQMTMADAIRRRLASDVNRVDVARNTVGQSLLVQIEAARRRLDRVARHVDRGLERRLEVAQVRASQLIDTLGRAMPQLIATARPRLLASSREIRQGMAQRIGCERDRSRRATQALIYAMPAYVARQASRHDRAAAQFAVLDPLSVLQRGYAVVRGAGGELITSVSEIMPGATLIVQFHDGAITTSASVQ